MIGASADGTEVLAGATVLVADDHEPNLLLMRRILSAAGVERVHVTTDPLEVVTLFHEVEPDIVLLDLHMPGVDGVDVMDEIRRSTTSGVFVPIIVLTADGTQDARERVLAAGANDFLTKPIDRNEVVLRVRNLLHTRVLHERLRAHNAALQAEIESTRAAEERANADAAAKRKRVRKLLDSGGIRIVYQPIVDLRTSTVIGCEALSRFDQEPLLSPHQWFSDAAEVGLGTELELAAVEAALGGFSSLGDAVLALNVSPATAVSDRLAEVLAGAPADKIVLEITEHARVDDYDRLAAALTPLRRAGIRVAVDDAGAGFASLSHILRLAPDIIKLDMSLVRGIDQDPIKRALSSSLVTFAHDIGARIIAEGVETASECRAVTELGVPWGQGYHLGRPGRWTGQSISLSGSHS